MTLTTDDVLDAARLQRDDPRLAATEAAPEDFVLGDGRLVGGRWASHFALIATRNQKVSTASATNSATLRATRVIAAGP